MPAWIGALIAPLLDILIDKLVESFKRFLNEQKKKAEADKKAKAFREADGLEDRAAAARDLLNQ